MAVRGIEIRLARPGEGPALTDLCTRSKAHWGYSAAFMERVAGELVVADEPIAEARVFVAERAAMAVGMAALGVTEIDANAPGFRPVEIDALFVAPEAIATGVGRALWDHLAGAARAQGATCLIVESDPNAVGFYQRMGAQATGQMSAPAPPMRRLPILVHRLDT